MERNHLTTQEYAKIISYREFYDVPRVFVVSYRDRFFLFNSPFDKLLDEYSNNYQIYLMPVDFNLELAGDWVDLTKQASDYLGELPVSSIEFDSTKRREVNATLLDNFNIEL